MRFEAATQYGDWKGTAAADEYGPPGNSIDKLFEAAGKVDSETEILIGFEFFIGEGYFFLAGYYHPKSESPDMVGWIPTLNADLQKSQAPIQVKRVNVEITQEEFFKYFKRFSVVMVERGFDLIGREYDIVE